MKTPWMLVLFGALAASSLLIFSNVIDSFFMGETLDYLGLVNARIFFHNLWGDTAYMSAHYARCAVRAQWGIEQFLFGSNPVGYHIVNILFHAINAFLLFILARKILGTSKATTAAGIIGAFIFIAHHGTAENVRWITERWDLSMGFFYICALLVFIRYRERGRGPHLLTLSVVLFFLSVCSKEMAFSFPLIILAYDLCYLGGYRDLRGFLRRKLPAHFPFWLATLLYFAYRFARHQNVADYQTALFGTSTLLHSVASYFSWFAYPFGKWVAAAILLFAFVLGGKKLRFIVLFVAITMLPASRIPEVWRGYLPTLGFCILWGAILTTDWVGEFSKKLGRPPMASQQRGGARRIVLLAQCVVVAILLAANAHTTLKENAAWDENATKLGFLASKIKADHPDLPSGSVIYVVGFESETDKVLDPLFWTSPLVFLNDEIKVEAFPFQHLYPNFARGSATSPDGFYIYAFTDGSLHEAHDLKRRLIEREASAKDGSMISLLDHTAILRSSGDSIGQESCIKLKTPENTAKWSNTIEVEIALEEGEPVESEPIGKLSWTSTDQASMALSACSLSFRLRTDTSSNTYRLPVGSLASWVFAREIKELSLCIEGGPARVSVSRIDACQQRFIETNETGPAWTGFDDPLHGFVLPRFMRMPRERFNYFTGAR